MASYYYFGGLEEKRPDWAKGDDEVLYVLTVADLKGVYEEDLSDGAWDALEESEKAALIEKAVDALESHMEGWHDALYTVVADKVEEVQKAIEEVKTR